MILRVIRHQYLEDDVLPAEHVDDWVDWTGEARDHFAVAHDPDTGEHRTFEVPIATAIIDRIQDVSLKWAWLVRTQYGFEKLTINDRGGTGEVQFTMPSNVRFWQGRFTTRWKFSDYSDAAPTLAPPVFRDKKKPLEGSVLLGAPKDKDLADTNPFFPSFGGTLLIVGQK